jgi:type IV pilus assembly protein PilM
MVKQQMGMPAQPGMPLGDHPAARVLESSGSAFVDEVRGSLDYYLAAQQSMPISRIVVTGGGGRLTGLAQRLSTATRLPVEYGNALASLHMGKTGLSPEQLNHVAPLAAVPVGLALGVAA